MVDVSKSSTRWKMKRVPGRYNGWSTVYIYMIFVPDTWYQLPGIIYTRYGYSCLGTCLCQKSGLRPSLIANRFKKLKMEVPPPSQACLTRETGQSAPRLLISLQFPFESAVRG